MKKRLSIAIAAVLALALVVGFGVFNASADDAGKLPAAGSVSVYNGTASTSLRSEGNTFYIDSAADLKYLADSVNDGNNYSGKTVLLTTDIQWNDVTNFASWTKTTTGLNQWTRIGNNWSRVFAGTFDGQGHTVSGIYYVYNSSTSGGGDQAHGFFGNLIGTVKNLNLKNCYFDGTNGQWATKLGAIAGLAQWGAPKIDNCHVVDTVVDGTGKTMVGGLVGTPWADVTNGVVSNSSFSGTVKAGSYSGGIVGRTGAKKLLIEKCTFNGALVLNGESDGGILGYCDPGVDGIEATVSKCVMNGTISGGTHGIGGIFGSTNVAAYNGTNVPIKVNINSCVNNASVTASQHFVGGIVGGHGRSGQTMTATNVLTIEDCLNTGKISGGTGDWYQYGGGILGGIENGASSTTIKNCVNTGDVKIWGYSGGILGGFKWDTAQQTAVISGCVNLGVVTSLRSNADTDGSIYGNKPGNTTISNCLSATEANNGVGGNTATLSGITAKAKADILATSEPDLAALGLSNWKIADGAFDLKTKYVPGAKTAAVDFSAVVALEGKAIAAGQFTVNLFKANSSFAAEATAYKTATNDVNGVADLGTVDLPAGTHYFVMKQVKGDASGYTYDESAYNVTVTVDDFGNILAASTAKAGVAEIPTSFSFKNTYTVSPSALNVNAKVNLTGRTVSANEFTLELYKADGADFAVSATSPLKTAGNDAEGNVYFSEVENYTAPGTYYYVIKQANTSRPGVTYELVNYNVTVTVVDESSQLKATVSATKAGASAPSDVVYANTYKAAPVQLTLAGTVSLTGKTLAADLFTYNLYATGMDFQVSGDPIKTVKNAADGAIALGALELTEKGTSYYVLRQNALAEGYTATVSEYLITVTAVDAGTGSLTASYTASKKGEASASPIAFANSYEKPSDRLTKPADASVYDGTVSESLRTEGKNVYIDSAADLAKFAEMLNAKNLFAGKNVILTTDIVWNATGDAEKWVKGEDLPSNTWLCGGWNAWFAGTFDGQGHTIYGLYGTSTKDNFGFLGAATNGAVVKNLVLANCAFVATRSVDTNANLGGVIGTVFCGSVTVDNVYAEVFLATAGNNVGGIVGYNHKTTDTAIVISNSVFAGAISGGNNVGGILGLATNAPDDGTKTGTVKLENVLNKGKVSGKANVGGLVGCNNKQSFLTVTDSVSVGLISCTSGGALYGKYNTTEAPTVADLYYLDVSASGAGVVSGTAVAADKLYGDAAKTNLTGLDFTAKWTAVADDAPMPTSVYTMLNPAPAGGEGGEGEGGEGGQQPQGPVVVLPEAKPSKDASVFKGEASTKLRAKGREVYIDSAADLALFAQKVTAGTSYAGKTIILTTDIIWNTGDADKWAAGTETPKYSWTCGQWSKQFQGVFDGNGHVISGLYNTSEKDNTGFIGAIAGKTAGVKNLALVNSTFIYTGSANANMGLIGVTFEGTNVTVDNCFVDANFVAYGGFQVGGFIGRVHNNKCTATITNSVFAGTVFGNEGVGGFVGRADCNTAEDAAVVTIKNCLNLGEVSGNKNVAGFVGYNNKGTVTIETSINAGKVTGGASSTGAFFGTGTEKVTLKDCVYVTGTAEKATGADLKDGVSTVALEAILGDAAKTTLTKFDFKKTWTPVKSGYPMPVSVYKLVYGQDPENNPGTSDFVPALSAAVALTACAAALLLLRKKRMN